MSPLSASAQCSSCGTRRATRNTAPPCASVLAVRARPSRRAAARPAASREGCLMTRSRPKPITDSRRRVIAEPAAPGAPPAHVPVLLDAVLDALAPRDGAVYVDGTFGAGGYSAALLAAARCRVLGIDRDPAAMRRGAALAAQHPGRLTLIEGRFGDLERLIGAAAPGPIAGVALDLGVSSMQLDDPDRGF